MHFDEYQKLARQTAIYPEASAVYYPALGVAGEAGEVCNKVKKVFRDHGGVVSPEHRDAIASEAGDVLWYLANLCEDLGLSLYQVAVANLAKLETRKKANTLSGEGDAR